jgi:hypothetical protein
VKTAFKRIATHGEVFHVPWLVPVSTDTSTKSGRVVVGVVLSRFWPLFGLVVRRPQLELRLLQERDFADIVESIDRGIHDLGTIPCLIPRTDTEP